MEILPSVAPGEIPRTARSMNGLAGMWTGLARRAIADAEQGQVTVVKVADMAEYKKMRNGTSAIYRDAEYLCRARIQQEPDGLTVYLELHKNPPVQPQRPARNGIRPVRAR